MREVNYNIIKQIFDKIKDGDVEGYFYKGDHASHVAFDVGEDDYKLGLSSNYEVSGWELLKSLFQWRRPYIGMASLWLDGRENNKGELELLIEIQINQREYDELDSYISSWDNNHKARKEREKEEKINKLLRELNIEKEIK